MQGRRMIDPEVFYRFPDADGRTLSVYADADRLEAHLKELATGDAEAIGHFCGLVRRFTRFRSRAEVTDVATPMTYVRYTGNWKGTYMTWVLTPHRRAALRAARRCGPRRRLRPSSAHRLTGRGRPPARGRRRRRPRYSPAGCPAARCGQG